MFLRISALFIILLYVGSPAQNLHVVISGAEGGAYIKEMRGEESKIIDSVALNDNSSYNYSFDENKNHPGVYRLSFEKNKWIDFVYDFEEIKIRTDAKNILDSLQIVESESNRLFYQFLGLNKNFKTKSELLQLILARYPADDEYYSSTKERLNEIQNEYIEFVNVESQKDPLSFVARYIRSSQLPVVDISVPIENQLNYLKTHALDFVNFHDDGLIYSDAFTNKTIEYLSYFRNPQLPLELLEKEFMEAIDSLLSKAKVNQIVYEHVVEYLIEGFRKFGFDNVLNYIVDNYVVKDDLCLDERTGLSLQRRIDFSRLLTIGNKAPDINLPDRKGAVITLKSIDKEKIVIVFYSSSCPHCKELLPKLHKVYKEGGKIFEVLAVSIDEKKGDWLDFIGENKLTWINVWEKGGWDGRSAEDYYIYATPTILVLDKTKKLMAKPGNLEELNEVLAR